MLTFEEKVNFLFEDICDNSVDYGDPFHNKNSSDISAIKELCGDNRGHIIELYKALAQYPNFKNVLTASEISFDIALHYIEKKDYELFDIFLNLSDFQSITDEGDHYLFSYLSSELSNEKFINYYNRFVIQKKDFSYKILSDFISTIVDNCTVHLFKEKLELLFENIPSKIVDLNAKKAIYDIFEVISLYGLNLQETGSFEKIIEFLASKVKKIDIADLINIHISNSIDPTILINSVIKNSGYMENKNNYDDLFEKYNKSHKCISKKFIDLLSADFIEEQKKKMIENPQSVIQCHEDIYLYTSIYIEATPEEKSRIKDSLKKAFMGDFQLSIIGYGDRVPNDCREFGYKKLYYEIGEMLENIKKDEKDSEVRDDLVDFVYNYIDMLSLKNKEVFGNEEIFKYIEDVWPELNSRIMIKDEQQKLVQSIAQESSLVRKRQKRL